MLVITVARKPLEGTVARNVLQWGCGSLNIDKSRIALEAGVDLNAVQRQGAQSAIDFGGAKPGDTIAMYKPGGRWPGNVVLAHLAGCQSAESVMSWHCEAGCPVAGLDQQSRLGGMHSADGYSNQGSLNQNQAGGLFGVGKHDGNGVRFGDTGGASRFFKQIKNDPEVQKDDTRC